MAGCVPCFIIPLLLFIFHRYIQPIILKFWNPWKKIPKSDEKMPSFSECPCRNTGGNSNEDSCQLTAKNSEAEKNGESCKLIGKEKSA